MSRTATLRRQHDAIAVLAGEITAAAEPGSGSLGGEGLHRLLRQLGTILTTHLASEDRVLYPQMLASSDHRTAATASRFCEEMGGLTNAYGEFAKRWGSVEALRANPAEFRREWAVLSGALAFRIQRENAELYPLADALAAAPESRAG